VRAGAEKRLVEAILDAEIGIDEIAERAAELGETLGERLSVITRNLIKLRRAGSIDAERAQFFFKQAYLMLTLLGFTKVAQDVKDLGDGSVADITDAARAYFKTEDGSKLAIVETVEKEQRKKERADG
jgi:DNA-binding transcriptional ArsR family regulator